MTVIPFSSGIPDDGLQVEELPGGDVLVGAPEIEEDIRS